MTDNNSAYHASDSAAAHTPAHAEHAGRTPWRYVITRTFREFPRHHGTDLASALTYHAMLSSFPAAIALLSLVGLAGRRGESVDALLNILDEAGGSGIAETVEPILTSLSHGSGAGFALAFGLLGAVWGTSGYVDAFSRGMNRLYGVREGRPLWKRRPIMALISAILLILAALTLVTLVISGPIATAVGHALGIGSAVVVTWQIAKWPVMAILVVIIIGILYYTTPNVKQPKFRVLTIGALVAITLWMLASLGFALYVAHFAQYNKTYGVLAGVIVFLLWLWISNLALILGAQFEAELQRGRQLAHGIAAAETIELPLRDDKAIIAAKLSRDRDIDKGRDIRDRS